MKDNSFLKVFIFAFVAVSVIFWCGWWLLGGFSGGFIAIAVSFIISTISIVLWALYDALRD
jgi:hypothetical protein